MAVDIFVEYTLTCTSQAAYNRAKAALGGISTLLAPATAATLVSGIGGFSGSTPPTDSIILGISAGNVVFASQLQPGTDITQAANHIELNPASGSYNDGKFSYSPFHILPCGLASITTTLHYPVYGADRPYTIAWSGTILLAAAGAPAGPTPRFLGRRRWVDGFELVPATFGFAGEETFSNAANRSYTRDASRTIDGSGLAIRNNPGAAAWASQNPNRTANALTQPLTSWERFYIRVRKFPTSGDDVIWAAKGSVQNAGDACFITISSAGVLKMYNQGNLTFPGTLLATGPALGLSTWYRFDIKIAFKDALGGAVFWLYINGAASHIIANPGAGTGNGLDLSGNKHIESKLGGSQLASLPHSSEFDFDDWISADDVVDPPGFPGNFPGMDLTSGSHVVTVHANGYGAAHNPAWVGDWRNLNQHPPTNFDSATAQVAVGAPATQLEATTDYAALGDGCAAFIVACALIQFVGVTGNMGWNINGSPSLFAYTPSTGFVSTAPIYSVSSGTLASALPVINTLNLEFLSPAVTVGTTAIYALQAAAEMIGVFGSCDNDPAVVTPPVYPPFSGIHNNPYAGLLQSPPAIVPVGAVTVSAGTYTGNAIGQDVLEQIAAHWWWVRDTTIEGAASGGGSVWWSSMFGTSPRGVGSVMASPRITRAHLLNGVPSMEVAGSGVANNAAARTYQWIAIADPAMRYVLNAAFSHDSSLTSAANTLVNSTYTPLAAFIVQQVYQADAFTTDVYYKGPGAGGSNASQLNAAQQANILTFAAGLITSQSALNHNTPQTAVSLFRLTDGSGDRWMDILSYVGNGAGDRDIPVTLQNRYPLFVLGVPHNRESFFRDPSHSGRHSTSCLNVDDSNAIIGGNRDIVSVGATLNANGIVYDLFVLPADGLNGDGSFGGNILDNLGNPSAFTPVPDSPGPLGPFDPPPAPPAPPDAGCISFGQAILELQTRLGDALSVHWTLLEIIEYLKESLHVYNALTMAYKGRDAFVAAPGVAFYELPAEIPALRSYNVLDRDEIRLLQYHIMEPPTPTGWTGTPQFTLDDLTQTLQRRLDLYKFATGQVITNEIVVVTPDSVGRVVMPLMITDLRRVAWVSSDGLIPPTLTTTPVLRASEWDMNAYARAWPTAVPATPTRPLGYSVSETPPLRLQLAPAPTLIGTLDTLAVVRCPDLSPVTGVLLGIPDDFCWVPKWGALMDMLATSGPASDPTRMAIAQILWDQGLAAARRSAVVLDARISDGITEQIVPVNSISEADYYLRNWQTATGAPRRVMLAGNNLLALTPVPDNLAVYTVTLNVIRNIAIPVLLSDCFYEGGAAVTAALLDYAEFLANFKEGASQAQAAFPLLQRFFKVCGIAVDLQSALMPQRGAMLQQTAQDERSPATFSEAAEPTDH